MSEDLKPITVDTPLIMGPIRPAVRACMLPLSEEARESLAHAFRNWPATHPEEDHEIDGEK